METPVNELIVSDAEVLRGKPCIRGTRISVEHVLELLASGASRDDILKAHPQVTPQGFQAALMYAAQAMQNVLTWHVQIPA